MCRFTTDLHLQPTSAVRSTVENVANLISQYKYISLTFIDHKNYFKPHGSMLFRHVLKTPCCLQVGSQNQGNPLVTKSPSVLQSLDSGKPQKVFLKFIHWNY